MDMLVQVQAVLGSTLPGKHLYSTCRYFGVLWQGSPKVSISAVILHVSGFQSHLNVQFQGYHSTVYIERLASILYKGNTNTIGMQKMVGNFVILIINNFYNICFCSYTFKSFMCDNNKISNHSVLIFQECNISIANLKL